jgi:hypothetical protein
MNLDQALEESRRRHREANTFDVYCSFRQGHERIIKFQMLWADALSLTTRLSERYRLRHPNKSCWIARIYGFRLHMETPVKKCSICGAPISGKATFCSARCRKISSRSRSHSSRSAPVT